MQFAGAVLQSAHPRRASVSNELERLVEVYDQAVADLGYVGRSAVPPKTRSPSKLSRLLSSTDAPTVLAMIARLADLFGLIGRDDFSASCMPSTNETPSEVRASTISLGVTEVFYAVLDKPSGELLAWAFFAPPDTEPARWPKSVDLIPASHGGGCIRVLGESSDDFETIVGGQQSGELLRWFDLLTSTRGAYRVGRMHDPALWELIERGEPFSRQAKEAVAWDVSEPDLVGFRKVRASQQRFRRQLLESLPNRCAVCHLDRVEILDAAHVIPHSQGGRASLANGQLLCANHHRAFDVGLLRWDIAAAAFEWVID